MTKHLPNIPSDKSGSLLKDAWEIRYREDGGTGDVMTWTLSRAKTEWMKTEIKRVFEGAQTFVIENGKTIKITQPLDSAKLQTADKPKE